MAHQQKRPSGRQPADTRIADPAQDAENAEKAQNEADTAAAAAAPPAPQQDGTEAPRPQPAQPKATTLNINDLKDMSIQKLTQVAKDLNVAGATGMRKQDLIFQILKAQTEQSGFMFSEGVLECCPTASASCGRPTTTTCPAPTTSTSRRRRSASSTCRPATRCPARCGRPRTASATSR